MKIIKLSSQNVKKLSAVEITPTGDLVVIAGKNGAGKSSVLDSIMYGLAGGDSLPKQPVRRGEDKARVKLDLGDLVVTRTFTAAGGTSLVVTGKDGSKHKSPQAVLDGLTGRLTFDPLEFSRQAPKAQAETLRALVGLDFTKADGEHDALFQERTLANRDVKNAQASLQANGPAPDPNTPKEKQSIAAWADEIQKATEHNRANEFARQAVVSCERELLTLCHQIDDLTLQIEGLKKRLDGLEADKGSFEARLNNLRQKATGKDIDVSAIRKKLDGVEELNRKVEHAEKYRERLENLRKYEAKAEKLDRQVEANRSAKAKAIRAAKFPIEGLSLEATGVTLGGIPFKQCSAAEQLKVSVAIGLALNPKLKVLLIRDGSLLDDGNLALVAKMAAEAQAQVWIERVEETGDVSVIIEDGHVRGQEPPVEQNAVPVTQNAVPVQQTEPPPED